MSIRRFHLTVMTTIWFLTLFISSASHAAAPQDLPRVVLIGDSIRLSYAKYVADQLQDKAMILSPNANCGDSLKVLKNLEAWVIQEKPDLVHFNCGIHDTKKFKQTGHFQVAPDDYAANLENIVQRIRSKTGAKVIFATSTPILDAKAAQVRAERDYELLNASIVQYNQIATKVMQRLQVPVNDLFELIAVPSPPTTTEQLILDDGVHLTEQAQRQIGKHVAQFILMHLN